MNKFWFFSVFLMFAVFNANAKIYQCTTEGGAVAFSDKPCPSKSKENEIVLKGRTGSPKLINATALDEKVLFSKPVNFSPMSKKMVGLKYPYSNQPNEVLSDSTGSVSLAFSYTTNKVETGDFEVLRTVFEKTYSTAQWIRSEISDQNGSTFIVLEFISTAIDTQIHNIIYATSVKGRMLIISFNTTLDKVDKWLPVGKKIMSSISIRN